MPPRLSFQTVDAYFDIIASSAPNAETFCEIWEKYLISVGWTIDEYEKYFLSLDLEGLN